MDEYVDMYELFFNWLFWFVLGTFSAYILFSFLEYLYGRRD